MGSRRQNGEARKIERKAATLRRVVREEAKIGPIYLSGSDCWGGGRGGETKLLGCARRRGRREKERGAVKMGKVGSEKLKRED